MDEWMIIVCWERMPRVKESRISILSHRINHWQGRVTDKMWETAKAARGQQMETEVKQWCWAVQKWGGIRQHQRWATVEGLPGQVSFELHLEESEEAISRQEAGRVRKHAMKQSGLREKSGRQPESARWRGSVWRSWCGACLKVLGTWWLKS